MREGPILVVEDEERLASLLSRTLTEVGFEVITAGNCALAEQLWREQNPRLVVLDVMLPDGDGLQLLTSARVRGETTPVLVLSAKSSMSERVSGLDMGADDYLGKPFGIEELLARVRVLLRRSPIAADAIHLADLEIDPLARRVARGDRRIFLSETEYRILELLAGRVRQTVSKREILLTVWGDDERDENVVEVYVSYLRSKLEWGGASRLIHTVRGRGYVLSDRVADA